MASNTNKFSNSIVRVCRVLFGFVAVYVAAIIASDAWNFITADVVLRRWVLAAIMLFATGAVWYLARQGSKSQAFYKLLVWSLIFVYSGVASYSVYHSRGVSSRSVMLFAIPILLAGVLASRVATFTAAILTTTAYMLTVVLYSTTNPGEGYKAELYTEAGFYVALFFVIAALIIVVQNKN